MDKESDVIKHQMEHTRAALTDKLELLEHKVTDSVSGAAEAVEKVRQTVQDTVSGASDTVASMKHAIEDTVASVKECARETAETVSETLDVRKQVQKHPWAMMAGATAIGFGVGVLVSRTDVRGAASSAASSMAHSAQSLAGNWSAAAGDHSPRWTGPQREQFVSRQPPAVQEDLSGQVGEVIDNFTTSLGGKPISGKILPDSWNGDAQEETGKGWQTKDGDWQGGSRRPRQTAMADIEE